MRPPRRRSQTARILTLLTVLSAVWALVARLLTRRRLRRVARMLIAPVFAMATLAGAIVRRRPRHGRIIGLPPQPLSAPANGVRTNITL